jgi:hypothetical protein
MLLAHEAFTRACAATPRAKNRTPAHRRQSGATQSGWSQPPSERGTRCAGSTGRLPHTRHALPVTFARCASEAGLSRDRRSRVRRRSAVRCSSLPCLRSRFRLRSRPLRRTAVARQRHRDRLSLGHDRAGGQPVADTAYVGDQVRRACLGQLLAQPAGVRVDRAGVAYQSTRALYGRGSARGTSGGPIG